MVFLIFFFWPGVSFAHKVSIFAWAEDGVVHTQSKFSGGKKVVNGKVEVFDQEGKRLLEGTTNTDGEFSFNAPADTDLEIVLTAGMGHKGSWTLAAEEIGGGPLTSIVSSHTVPTDSSAHGNPFASSKNGVTGNNSTRGKEAAPLSIVDVETIVARQLDKKLAPLTRMLAAEQDKGPTFSDIFGGIGYILGLVGLGAYIRYRKEGRHS